MHVLPPMTTRRKWSLVWGTWLTYFAVAEYIAVRSHHRDAPLSAHCRYILRSNTGDRTQRAAGQLVFGAGLVWLVRHIWND